MMNATVAISVVIAVAVFMVLPYFLSSLLKIKKQGESHDIKNKKFKDTRHCSA